MIRKKMIGVLLVLSLCLIFVPAAFAGNLTEEEQLGRISTLEKEVAELKTMIKSMQSKQAVVTQKVENIEEKTIAGSPAAESLVSGHKVKMYGFLKLDSSIDDSKTNNPDAPKYASSEATVSDEKQYAMTAMNTRLGLNYSGSDLGAAKTFGNVELDFYDTASDNSQKPRMRHAYFKLNYPRWELLAGQTWDIFGPLGPNTLNTNGYLWNGGNIGFRRPQVRLTNNFDFNEGKKVVTQLSINRNIGIANGTVNTGENSGYPMAQARAAYTFPFLGEKSTIGVAGLYGMEEYNRNDTVTDDNYDVSQWGVGLDLSTAFNSWLSLKGEFFRGSNLDALLAGIGYGINTTKEEGVDTRGGWAQLTCKPWDKYAFNLGYGIERLDRKI
ncbi:MAG: hypothetical protein ABIH08_02220 [Candidatus Omnitrophota bacterium]